MAWTADPFTHDTTLIVGDTWLVEATLEDASGVPHDLTGVTGEASIRSEPGGVVVATPTVSVTSATDGEFSVSVPATTTADLAPGSYRWAARLEWGDGTIKTVVEGRLTVRRAVVA
jgi:hypothetical protein